MPKQARELKALEVKKLTTPGRHAVGGTPPGLSLSINKTGARSWIFRVTINNKRCHIGLGSYPEVSLAEAREMALNEKRQIRTGIDPVEKRREARTARKAEAKKRVTFAEAFDRYDVEKLQSGNGNAKHKKQWRSTLTTYAFPVIGEKPVGSITTEDIVAVLRPIWDTKTETASRVRQRIEAVLDWSKVMGFRNGDNPAAWKGNLKQIMPSPDKIKKVRGHPAVALDEISTWFGQLQTREGIAARALQFLTLTASRSGEVRGAVWDEMDLKHGVWTIPAERMKAGKEHRVPLSAAALDIIINAPRLLSCPYVFPSPRNGQMSDMTISAVMRRLQAAQEKAGRVGFLDPRSRRPAVPHGLRSSFRDWTAERTNYPRDMAEMALAHAVGTDVERAYRRTDMLERRREMMEEWGQFCLGAA